MLGYISDYEYSKYSGQSGTSTPYFISQLNFDSIPGSIAVGAADWLYVLNLNLTMAKQVNLLPQASTSACSAAIGYNPDYVCRNHLRVFPSSPTDPTRLLVCGSEAIGTPSCRAVNMSNLLSFTSVTAANGMVSIRPDFYGSGIAYNVSNPRGINIFAVSTLNLDASNTGLFFLTVNYTNPTDPNSLYTVLQLRTNSIANFKAPVFVDTYRANYAPRTALLPGVMDPISPDEHKYFYAFVRDTDSTNNDPGNSGDNAPLTLVKARINCNSATYSTNYNAISSVHSKYDNNILTFSAQALSMGRYYQNGDWSLFMYGVFTTTIGGVTLSAVCVYPANNSVEDSTGQFGRNGGVFDIFRTLLVNPTTGAQTTSGYVECTTNGNMARPDYTYTDTVLPITQIGTEPLAVFNGVTVTKIVLDQTCVVTSTAQTCVIQDVLFLGTAAGTVLKVASGFTSGSIFSIVSEEIKLDDTSSVRQISIQQQGGVKYLYVNTDTSIYRLPVQRCGRYLSCSTCVGSRDPYCVWNTSLSQCVVSSIVPTNYNGSASVPNGIYQNIHTGVVSSCPALTLSVSNSLLGTSQPAFIGSNITFVCTANDGHNGATVTSYQWYKNGVVLNNGGTIHTLSVSSVTLLDQGTYQCNAINVEGSNSSLSNGIQLTVIDVMVTSQPQSLTNVLPGRMASFSVTAAGAESFTFQWQYGNGTNIPPGGRYQGVTTSTLVISSVIGGDNSSVYVCRVTSPSGNTTTTQPAYLMLASSPIITQQPTATLSVTFGQNASLSCSANGLDPLTVRWTTPPGMTPPQSRQYGGYDITDTLVLSSVNTTHRGTYMCVVTDSRGTEVLSMPSILRVIVPTPNAVAVVKSLLGTFSCITNDGVGGATITSYQWVKNGVALANGGRVTGANQPTLSISNVMPQDQGLYQCNVTNVDGATSLSTATTLLFVEPCAEACNETANKMAPSITVVIENRVSLNITVKPESVSASLNSQVTLICQMTGCPSPQITWYKDNVVISNVPSLVIPALTLSHRGLYACKSGDMSSDAVRLSTKGVYQYFVHIQLNTSATLDIATELHAYLTGRYVLNNSAKIILVNIRLLKILNYYSNNAIINETTVFTGKTFAIQLEDIPVSNGCFTGRNFSINLGSIDTVLAQNTTIFRSAISSNRIENTTASVLVLPSPSNECALNTTSIYRLTFYTFLHDVLFRSTKQEKEGFKIGSIIISVGGNAIRLAEKLQFTFQVVKDAKNAKPAQWINDSNQTGKWSTEGCTILSTQNNMFTTEVKLQSQADTITVYQGNFAMLLDLNPGSVTCPEADIVTLIGTVLSIISLLFFLVTYLCSKPLRKSEHGTVLINISCALLCLYIVFLMAAYSKSVPALCGISAALVHYFMLVYFMWTAAEAVFLFIKLVKVLGNKINHFTLKAGLLSWLVPLGIVIISAGAGYRYYYNSKYCRASELPFYLGFITPFLGIYVFNWIMFTMIIVSLCKQSARSATGKAGNGHKLRNVLIAAGLALVLGLGWGFGLAASSNNINALACSFQFLFSVFVSCQGLLLLFVHGVRNKNATKVWRSWVGLHSKSYTVTMSMRPGEGGNAMKSHRDQTASSQPTSCPGNQPDTSCEELKKAATTDETLIDEGSN
eukprot:Em0024g169a